MKLIERINYALSLPIMYLTFGVKGFMMGVKDPSLYDKLKGPKGDRIRLELVKIVVNWFENSWMRKIGLISDRALETFQEGLKEYKG